MSDRPDQQPIPPEALQQLEMLKRAAMLAAQGKFHCNICNQVHSLMNGVCVLARQNIILGVCLKCAERTAISLEPSPGGYRIGTNQRQPTIIQAANLADVRAVERSKLTTGELTDIKSRVS